MARDCPVRGDGGAGDKRCQLVIRRLQVQALLTYPIEVLLNKILKPQLLLVAGWHPAWLPLQLVYEWLNVRHTL